MEYVVMIAVLLVLAAGHQAYKRHQDQLVAAESLLKRKGLIALSEHRYRGIIDGIWTVVERQGPLVRTHMAPVRAEQVFDPELMAQLSSYSCTIRNGVLQAEVPLHHLQRGVEGLLNLAKNLRDDTAEATAEVLRFPDPDLHMLAAQYALEQRAIPFTQLAEDVGIPLEIRTIALTRAMQAGEPVLDLARTMVLAPEMGAPLLAAAVSAKMGASQWKELLAWPGLACERPVPGLIDVLAVLPDPEPLIGSLLSLESPTVREAACLWMIKHGTAKSVPQLRQVDGPQKKAAGAAIAKIQERTGGEVGALDLAQHDGGGLSKASEPGGLTHED